MSTDATGAITSQTCCGAVTRRRTRSSARVGGGETHRVISSVALHKTMGTKMSELDSKYDRMLDAADSTNPRADPNYYLSKATPLSEGTPD